VVLILIMLAIWALLLICFLFRSWIYGSISVPPCNDFPFQICDLLLHWFIRKFKPWIQSDCSFCGESDFITCYPCHFHNLCFNCMLLSTSLILRIFLLVLVFSNLKSIRPLIFGCFVLFLLPIGLTPTLIVMPLLSKESFGYLNV
jgi:hypothetical protein